MPQESAPIDDVTVLELATGHLDENQRWEVEPKAKRILSGLAFRESDFERNARTLSGGWVMRAHLPACSCRSRKCCCWMRTDEPPRPRIAHLVPKLPLGYPGAILMISHDREFLNALCAIACSRSLIARSPATPATTTTTSAKGRAHGAAPGAYDNQQRELAKMQAWVDKFKAKANFASRAQDKAKMIDRIEKIDAPMADAKTVKFRFPQPPRSGQRVIRMTGIDFAYGQTPVYHGLDLEMERGQRTVLVGPNGAGKSTLLKLLAGALTRRPGIASSGTTSNSAASPNIAAMCSTCATPCFSPPWICRAALAKTFAAPCSAPSCFTATMSSSPSACSAVAKEPPRARAPAARPAELPPHGRAHDAPRHGQHRRPHQRARPIRRHLVFISHDVHFIRQMAKTSCTSAPA